ncbi:putative O-glycosylation ligase, exosortase A system-associated [Hydrogenophaga sp.]|uniref:putative O-glycosylation ligase, exosortase A system-associated n=1 Tax=Hydrogenophaga sp. TaxID=1904254 RepID=UPI0019A26AA9|nr:putative O-glycosylation ligase, exosortase A system-associated [Hydrogenophaga sp.]MBD3893567.1 putative O-glycosylation ligase, exosortase A system-associated [Hydrogenophaga sp.]
MPCVKPGCRGKNPISACSPSKSKPGTRLQKSRIRTSPVRDLLVFGFMLLFVPLAFTHSYTAYLLWGWAGLIAIGSYLYGFMIGVPFVQIFAMITMASLLLLKDSENQRFEFNRTTVLFLLFVLHGFFCALFAYPGLVRNWELFSNLAKTVLFCLFMPMLVTNRLRIHALVIMIAIATSFHGVLDGLKFIASGGAHNAQVILKFGDNNHLAMVLAMVLPLLYYLWQYSSHKLIRWGFAGALLLTVLAVVATHSRGGLIALFTVALLIVLRSRKIIPGLVFVLLSGFLVLQLAPTEWTERMQTIQTAEEDESFMGRVTAWKVSSAIAVEHPIFGGGFRAIQSYPVWDKFKDEPGLLGFIETPDVGRSGVAAHSIWFEVLGDLGFVGFFIFLALFINAAYTYQEIRRLVKQAGVAQRWAGDLAGMLIIALCVYLVAGSLLSVAYFELPYICMMLLEVIRQQQRRQAQLPLIDGTP